MPTFYELTFELEENKFQIKYMKMSKEILFQDFGFFILLWLLLYFILIIFLYNFCIILEYLSFKYSQII